MHARPGARLGLIDERYADPRLSAERAALRAADRRLADIAQALRTGAPNPRKRLTAWRLEASKLELQLRRREALSLFNRNSF